MRTLLSGLLFYGVLFAGILLNVCQLFIHFRPELLPAEIFALILLCLYYFVYMTAVVMLPLLVCDWVFRKVRGLFR